MKDTAAVPRGERPETQNLIHRGGCVGGKYGLWMDELGLDSVGAVQTLLDEHDVTPITDTAGRASDEKYNRPTDHDAYLCLTSGDARTLLNQTE